MCNLIKNDCISWLGLATLLRNSDYISENHKKVLAEYYMCVECIYEKIIDKWDYFDKIAYSGEFGNCDAVKDFDIVFNELRE